MIECRGFFMVADLTTARLALLLVLLLACASTSSAQTDKEWQVRERSFATFEELATSKLERGVVYRVTGDLSDDPSRRGLFYFIEEPLPTEFAAGGVIEIEDSRLLFRPDTQSPEIRAEWFGAVGDGIADDGLAIEAALDYFDRVDLMGKTYGVGKGIYLHTETVGRWILDVRLMQDSKNWHQSIPLNPGDKVFGEGPRKTKVRLLDNTNPRPPGGDFSIFGTLYDRDTANVVVKGLHIDVNFDGQSKSRFTPAEVRVVDGKPFELPSTNEDVPAMNAVKIMGSNPLIEDLLVTGYSSNAQRESFVIMTELPLLSPKVSNRCGTIRNVEMTNPGSNLEIKYRLFGRESLAEDKRYKHIAEITHIGVNGATNFLNTKTRFGWTSVPQTHDAWAQIIDVDNIDALSSIDNVEAGRIVRVNKPGPTFFVYESSSIEPADELTSFALNRYPFNVLPGRVSRLPSYWTPASSDLVFQDIPEMVAALAKFPTTARPPNRAVIKVLGSPRDTAEYYLVRPAITGPNYVTSFAFKTKRGQVFDLHRILPPNRPCDGWNCEPTHDPSWLGENASNTVFCEGGLVENVHIHDETMNPEGYSAAGERYGLIDPRGVNASHLHGISASATRGLTIRDNRFTNFQGIGVYIMSWWNEGIDIENNWFDGVFSAITLSSQIEGDSQQPFQFPRHRGISIINNYVRLGAFSTTPPSYLPAGFTIIDMSNGDTYPGSLPLDKYPRFDSIEFRDNRITGRPFAHIDRTLGTMYPAAVLISSKSYLSDIRITGNLVDLKPNPTLIPTQHRNNRLMSTAFLISPGYFYDNQNTKRHDILFANNRDSLGISSDEQRVAKAFSDLGGSRPRWIMPRAFPILFNDLFEPYRIGTERIKYGGSATLEQPVK
jgi:hypothetical protein